MSLVKVRPNGQVTLPSSLRERAKLSVGDLLEAKLEKGKITLTPASLIDRHIAESREQIKKGQFYGPFDTAEEMIESLHRKGKRRGPTNAVPRTSTSTGQQRYRGTSHS